MAHKKYFGETTNREDLDYYIYPRLRDNLLNKVIPSLTKKDKDVVIAIDGGEGTGKSTLALQIGKFVDPTLELRRIVFNAEDFRKAIFEAKKGQCIIYDEAFTGLSSRSSLSGINKALVSLMMQMRQKNLFVIIVLPTFFLLDKYVALFRTKALFHVYESGGNRGYFKVYNRKAKKRLFLEGKATYSYMNWKIKTNFKGRFYGVFALGDEKIEKAYREKKAKALEETEKTPMSAGQIKYREQRDILMFILRKKLGYSYQTMEELCMDYGMDISYVAIRNICAKFGDKEQITDKEPKKVEPAAETNDILLESSDNTEESDENPQNT